jgi:putative acetyltransferase
LRSASALTVSLVAEQAKRIVGHIAFSPVCISDRSPGWYGLGPVSVTPPLQGRGIGRALIERGLQQLCGLGAQGCVVFGNPGLYSRFGFARDPDLLLAGVSQEFFLALPFGAKSAEGEVTYHAAFSAAG